MSLEEQRQKTEEKLNEMDELVGNADTAKQDTIESFDELYDAKVKSIAYMYHNNVMTGYAPANMQTLKKLLGVDNVLIVDTEGNIIAQAQKTEANFTYSRYNQLRTTFTTGAVSDAFDVTIKDKTHRYYGYKINDKTMAVIEQSTAELDLQLEAVSTWKSILGNVHVGLNGYAFAISAQDYTFLYYPDENLENTDSLSAGVSVKDLENNTYKWMDIDGERLYCGIKKLGEVYIGCAVTENEITSSRNVTVAMILFTVFSVLTLVMTYAFFITNKLKDSEKIKLGNSDWLFNKSVGRRIVTICLIGLVCILLISFYMQTLFALSQQSTSNLQKVQTVEKEILQSSDARKETESYYDGLFLNKAQVAAYIIKHNKKLANREALAELSEILDIESINIFNAKGVQTATNSLYTKFQLSDNPKDQSYDFNKLLLGREYLIQEARIDDVSGEYHQYIGVTLRNKKTNEPDGFVQISIVPSKLEEAAANMQIDKILSNVRMSKGGITFAVNKEDNTFVYYPDEKLIGKNSEKYGLEKEQLADEYSGYMDLNGTKFFGTSLETNDYYVYASVPTDRIYGKRMPLTIASVVASIFALGIMFLLLTITRKKDAENRLPEVPKGEVTNANRSEMKKEDTIMDAATIDVEMPDNTIRKSSSASSRWSNATIKWTEKTAEQQMFLVFKGIISVLAFVICFIVLFGDQIFSDTSIFSYVLMGKWARGFNIFAFTAALLIIGVVSVATMLLQKILKMLSRTLSAKGETVCRLLHNILKYASVLGVMYYCLALFGIDTSTLLASAGILTLVVGLGAQSLVSDILAGLFIIFEGEFQVGDIVTIGDYRGKVVEIGVRTTKIQDGNQNIKIINNKDVCGVINMTRDLSYAWTDVGIDNSESLERVEEILESEFPNIREHLPDIVEGPFYKGIISLGAGSINVRVMVCCSERDRIQMERDLNREMKLIFDRYGINVQLSKN